MKNVIYVIKNFLDDRCYIGSALDFKKRKRVHLCYLKKKQTSFKETSKFRK